MAFADDKAEILALMRNKGCIDVGYVDSNATSYDDLLTLLRTFAKTFDCDPDYLRSILLSIDDVTLTSYGIYVDKVLASVDRPTWIVSSTITTVNMTAIVGTTFIQTLEIHRTSAISTLNVNGGMEVGELVVSSDSVVTTLNVEVGSKIGALTIKACGARKGEVTTLNTGADIEDFTVDETAVFGKLVCPANATAT